MLNNVKTQIFYIFIAFLFKKPQIINSNFKQWHNSSSNKYFLLNNSDILIH